MKLYDHQLNIEGHAVPDPHWTPVTRRLGQRNGKETSIICGKCRTAEYLVFEQIKPVLGGGLEPEAWDVECWCGNCEQFYGMRTPFLELGRFCGPENG
ncbi:hypothetical protein [Paeniglutamicibacter antarcticus]|uniref:Uncharacterized protein n=1 Tax=Paeniglutamicibacter antarcticus TaxID=494023 RepID=A0ABP9TRP1_9MICC